jgi:hypothetical protein
MLKIKKSESIDSLLNVKDSSPVVSVALQLLSVAALGHEA